MSETVNYIGKLLPVEILGDLEQTAKNILAEHGIPPSKFDETALEQLQDDLYKEYVVVGDSLFKVEAKERDPYDSIFEAKRNEDGTVDFVVQYYNGGCSLGEALQIAMEKCK